MGECRFEAETRRLLKDHGEYLCLNNGRELWRVPAKNGRLFTLPARARSSSRIWRNQLSQIRRAISGIETKPGRVFDPARSGRAIVEPDQANVQIESKKAAETTTVGSLGDAVPVKGGDPMVQTSSSAPVQAQSVSPPPTHESRAQVPAKIEPLMAAQTMADQALALAQAAEGWRDLVKGLVEELAGERRAKETALEKVKTLEKTLSIKNAEFAKFNGRDFPKELERAEAIRVRLEAEKSELRKKIEHLDSALKSVVLANGVSAK